MKRALGAVLACFALATSLVAPDANAESRRDACARLADLTAEFNAAVRSPQCQDPRHWCHRSIAVNEQCREAAQTCGRSTPDADGKWCRGPTDAELVSEGVDTTTPILQKLLADKAERDRARRKREADEDEAAAKAAAAAAARQTARELAAKEARRREFLASLVNAFAGAPDTDGPPLAYGAPSNPKDPFCRGRDGALLRVMSTGQWEAKCCYGGGGAGSTGAGQKEAWFQVDQNVRVHLVYATAAAQNENCPMFLVVTPIVVSALNASTTNAAHLDFKWSALFTPAGPSSQTDFLGEQSASCDIPPGGTVACGPSVTKAVNVWMSAPDIVTRQLEARVSSARALPSARRAAPVPGH